MHLGISSYTYTWAVGVTGWEPPAPLTPLGLLERAVELGVPVVQIADNLPLHRLSGAELEGLAAAARERGVGLEVGTRGCRPEQVLPYVEIARRVGSPILRTVLDAGEDRPALAEAAGRLQALAPHLERAEVALAIENHDRLTTDELLAVLRQVGSPRVGICLDTANSLGALEGPGAVVAGLAPHALNLHLKDFTIARVPHQMGFSVEGRPAGQGRLDIPAVLAALQGHGRDGISAILELWTPPAATLAETLAREADWARQSIAYLRRLIPAGQEDGG